MMLTDRFDRALIYARAVHNGQVRKGTKTPYVSHLLMVTGLVLEHGGSEDEAIGALLHDAAEDQGGEARLTDIKARFGRAVRDIVAACSDTFESPKPSWLARKIDYVSRVEKEESASAILVSAADKLANASAILSDCRDCGDALWTRFNADAGKDGTIGYYRGLVNAYQATGLHPRLVRDLGVVG
jgi:(p)ppGpp synthase/HD superfamily hydrolase